MCTPSWRAMAFIWIKHQSTPPPPPPPSLIYAHNTGTAICNYMHLTKYCRWHVSHIIMYLTHSKMEKNNVWNTEIWIKTRKKMENSPLLFLTFPICSGFSWHTHSPSSFLWQPPPTETNIFKTEDSKLLIISSEKLNIIGSFSWKLVKMVTEDKNSKCDSVVVIIWKWKLDILCT